MAYITGLDFFKTEFKKNLNIQKDRQKVKFVK